MKNRTLFSRLLSGVVGLWISGLAAADICPMTSDIIASNPDVEGFITYFAPGWHSHPVPAIDLTKSDFYWVYADSYITTCVYDTPSGYLVLYPNTRYRIAVATIADNYLWYCMPAQSPYGFANRLMEICVCRESRTACDFYLQYFP